jgi:hypothetical protein
MSKGLEVVTGNKPSIGCALDKLFDHLRNKA